MARLKTEKTGSHNPIERVTTEEFYKICEELRAHRPAVSDDEVQEIVHGIRPTSIKTWTIAEVTAMPPAFGNMFYFRAQECNGYRQVFDCFDLEERMTGIYKYLLEDELFRTGEKLTLTGTLIKKDAEAYLDVHSIETHPQLDQNGKILEGRATLYTERRALETIVVVKKKAR